MANTSTQALRAPASKVAVAGTVLLAGVAGTWTLRTFDPAAATSVFPPCVFHLLTGQYCPGCGLTRALHALVHGDIARAWAMNPLAVIALPLLAMMLGQWLLGRRWLPLALNRPLHDGRAWIGVLLGFGVLRNLPWVGFGWMAPG